MAEYIDREAAIKAIYDSDPNGIRRTLGFNVGQIEEALRAVPAVSVPQWISIKDGLPDVNRTAAGYEEITVIATDGRNVRPMIYERACIRGKAKYRWKLMWDRIYDGKPIVAWMPLPEPPKGDADNG
nr:MAG TPA: Protein of unknown function (DUF551) [Caudoviricetes sp.]DAH94996.1 MAG TPA: Protein of unknown function (DUF551) [Caudoviricetes sp.]